MATDAVYRSRTVAVPSRAATEIDVSDAGDIQSGLDETERPGTARTSPGKM
jgi:hypothetical protein